MTRSPAAGRNERLFLLLAVGLLVAIFVFGGSARADAFNQFFARCAAVLVGSIALVTLTRADLRSIKVPFLLCAGWAAIIVLQLVPLPPLIWTALPGRERFLDLASLAGVSQPWRPLSLVPEATANSALAMLIPLAVLVTLCQVPARRFPVLLMTLVGFTLISGLVGVAQVAAGGASYFYDVSNRGDGVGLFANRNHQAVLLAATVPLLAGLANLKRGDPSNNAYGIFASIVFVLVFPLVFVTGSRSGVLMLLVGIGLSTLILVKTKRIGIAVGRLRTQPVLIAGAIAIVLAGTALALFRVGAVDRMLTQSVQDDLRISLLETMFDMAKLYFPFGGGFGAFPTLFKVDEPFFFLNYNYFNHAHNDLVEIVIEGGLLAVLLLLIFFGWIASATWRLWRAPYQSGPHHVYGLVGTAALLILLVASLADYPLRTPGLAAVAAVLVLFIARADMSLSSRQAMVDRRRDENSDQMDCDLQPRSAAS